MKGAKKKKREKKQNQWAVSGLPVIMSYKLAKKRPPNIIETSKGTEERGWSKRVGGGILFYAFQ